MSTLSFHIINAIHTHTINFDITKTSRIHFKLYKFSRKKKKNKWNAFVRPRRSPTCHSLTTTLHIQIGVVPSNFSRIVWCHRASAARSPNGKSGPPSRGAARPPPSITKKIKQINTMHNFRSGVSEKVLFHFGFRNSFSAHLMNAHVVKTGLGDTIIPRFGDRS